MRSSSIDEELLAVTGIGAEGGDNFVFQWYGHCYIGHVPASNTTPMAMSTTLIRFSGSFKKS